MKNRKGLSNISIIFYYIIFVILWALFFAEQVSFWGHMAVVNGNLTGIEALLYDHVNLVIGFVSFLFVLAIAAVGGNN